MQLERFCFSVATEAHVAQEGAAGSIFAASLENPTDSDVEAVMSLTEKALEQDKVGVRTSTYAGSGASGRVALSIKRTRTFMCGNEGLFMPPARNGSFTGRVRILDKLWQALQSDCGRAKKACRQWHE